MYDGIVADGNIVPDNRLRFLIGGMYHYAILDIYLVADADTVDVASYDGIEPDAAFIANLYVAYDGGIGRDETILSKLWELAFDGEDSGHG
jgi:hypothetical protein